MLANLRVSSRGASVHTGSRSCTSDCIALHRNTNLATSMPLRKACDSLKLSLELEVRICPVPTALPLLVWRHLGWTLERYCTSAIRLNTGVYRLVQHPSVTCGERRRASSTPGLQPADPAPGHTGFFQTAPTPFRKVLQHTRPNSACRLSAGRGSQPHSPALHPAQCAGSSTSTCVQRCQPPWQSVHVHSGCRAAAICYCCRQWARARVQLCEHSPPVPEAHC